MHRFGDRINMLLCLRTWRSATPRWPHSISIGKNVTRVFSLKKNDAPGTSTLYNYTRGRPTSNLDCIVRIRAKLKHEPIKVTPRTETRTCNMLYLLLLYQINISLATSIDSRMDPQTIRCASNSQATLTTSISSAPHCID